jgi:hypothetical protein
LSFVHKTTRQLGTKRVKRTLMGLFKPGKPGLKRLNRAISWFGYCSVELPSEDLSCCYLSICSA